MRVTRFLSRSGIRTYQMPVETFPGHVDSIYLILGGELDTLFGVGSGTSDSIQGLQARMAEVQARSGQAVALAGVQHVVIRGAHIDHFGRVGPFARETEATVHVHELPSLETVRALRGVTPSLPGHEAPIEDLAGRIGVIVAHHGSRLNHVLCWTSAASR